MLLFDLFLVLPGFFIWKVKWFWEAIATAQTASVCFNYKDNFNQIAVFIIKIVNEMIDCQEIE